MPHSEAEDTTIPVIDISTPSDEVARQVLDAASTHGFLFIKNDGVTIPPQDIDDMFSLVSHQEPSILSLVLTPQSLKNTSVPQKSKRQNMPSTLPKLAV